MGNKRRVTIELTEKDQEHIKIIRGAVGHPALIAIIRHALWATARSITASASERRVKKLSPKQLQHAQMAAFAEFFSPRSALRRLRVRPLKIAYSVQRGKATV